MTSRFIGHAMVVLLGIVLGSWALIVWIGGAISIGCDAMKKKFSSRVFGWTFVVLLFTLISIVELWRATIEWVKTPVRL